MALNATRTNTPINSTVGSNAIQQFVFPVIIVLVLYCMFMFLEIMYKYINRLSVNRVDLLPNTYTNDNTKIISQNPLLTDKKLIQLSDNERTGIEFTYSFYLFVNPSSFTQDDGLLHIFHKGYASQFPLLGPGVYMRSNKNTLRVYMNTFKTWNNFVEIDNFPLSKWVHIAIVCTNDALEVFINGNLTKKLSFDGFVPYQNYQDLICFSKRRIIKSSSTDVNTPPDFNVLTSMTGMISRLTYFNYALCYAEIKKEMDQGPSSKMDSTLMADAPPYLADTWWTDSSKM
jgi:hypothetical protein